MFGISIRESLAFPFQRFTLETSTPMANVLKRMQETVEPRRRWRFKRPASDFEGVLSTTSFRIRRIITHRNSFIPVVIGTIRPRIEGGTRIDIAMRMRWHVTLFMLLWFSLPIVLLAASLLGINLEKFDAPSWHRSTWPQLFVPLVMIVWGYCLCAVAFNIEASRARLLLMKICAAELN